MFEDKFELNSEQIDSLRLETQSISPKEQVQLERIITNSHKLLLKQFGEYISNKKSDKEAISTFIFTDPDTYKTFFDEWTDSHNNIKYSKGPGVMRAYSKEGKFVIGFLSEYWDKVVNKQEAIGEFGNEESAQKEIKNMVARGHIIHELSHIYQNSDLPLWFLECGAYWYSHNVPKSAELNIVSMTDYDKPVDFFDSLISKYGDDVHKLSFSNKVDKEIQDRIFRGITSETIKDIFPDYEE